MPSLFKPNLIERYIRDREPFTEYPEGIVDTLEPWVKLAREKDVDLTETNLDVNFLRNLFVDTLGYVFPPSDSFTLVPQRSVETRGTPDFIIGDYEESNGLLTGPTRAVGELKGPSKNLDRVDSSSGETPVQQAFRYGTTSGLEVMWVIVSNMREIRLYRVNNRTHYETFQIREFVDEEGITDEFKKFFHLLKSESLLKPAEDNEILSLTTSSIAERVELTESFYRYYRKVLSDVLKELTDQYPEVSSTQQGKIELAEAAQKLLHRGLMICFMSDHPERLLPRNLLDNWIKNAYRYPVYGERIYKAIQALFRALDEGDSSRDIFPYDGGLFRNDKYLDSPEFIIPDDLFFKEYNMNGQRMKGIFGFREIDFYHELNPHLLGRLFEYSIADQEEIFRRISSGVDTNELANIQGELGVIYTREILAEFGANLALSSHFDTLKKNILEELNHTDYETLDDDETQIFWNRYLEALQKIRILDLSVGSGAFLVECYKILRREAENAHQMTTPENSGVLTDYFPINQAILDNCLYGKDILPGAVSIAELALWLASARKEFPLTNLSENFLVGDSLDEPEPFPEMDSSDSEGFQKFDLVIGNPPWGGEVSQDALDCISSSYPDLDNPQELDTFELFLRVGSKYLKENGRLCYILPHSILYPEKKSTRKWLLEKFEIQKWHYLGSDWFGPDIRMNTTILLMRNKSPHEDSKFDSMLLTGEERRQAIRGELSLLQLDRAYSKQKSQARCIEQDYEVQLFRYDSDEAIMNKMKNSSRKLKAITSRGRGVEMNKEGHIIQCPACSKWDVPPRPVSGVSRNQWEKECSNCGHRFKLGEAIERSIIVNESKRDSAPYINGDSFDRRYSPLEYNKIELDADGINYKSAELYKAPKIFIRQAGVGIVAAYDEKGAYCPQSVYVYRMSEDKATNSKDDPSNKKWSEIVDPKFLLAVLESRIMAYYVFKLYGEIDAAQPFSKFTHTRLAKLPIPVREWSSEEWKSTHDEIMNLVEKMLSGESLGSDTDYRIESLITRLYGLSEEDRLYVFHQLGYAEYHKTMKELFPFGPPPKPDSAPELKLNNTEQ